MDPSVIRIIIGILSWFISSQIPLLHHDIAVNVVYILAVLVMVASVLGFLLRTGSSALLIRHGCDQQLFQDLVLVRKLLALDDVKKDKYFGIICSVIFMSKSSNNLSTLVMLLLISFRTLKMRLVVLSTTS